MRGSSDELEEGLVEGILDEGLDVVKLGLATTPMVYFSSGKLEVDGAVMITASHNPSWYNGFKICLKNAVPVGEGSGIEKIKKMALEEKFKKTGKRGTNYGREKPERRILEIHCLVFLRPE